MALIPRGKGGARYPVPNGLANVSGAADVCAAQAVNTAARLTGVSQEESWEAQLPLNMLGHRAWKCRLGQGFIDVLVA